MSQTVIQAENLGKKYLISHQDGERERYTALRDVLARQARGLFSGVRSLWRGEQLLGGDTVEEFWALQDLNFSIQQGDRVGIIGRNGAGKSTLLKILSRITEPSTGRVSLRGRVASLLEVGTGFHPELTGRENIFLNGAILGMTRHEIKRKFDEIVDFAGVERFLDTPVKRYSSGMYVRLAFAVAAHLEPEILVVDEVLAVGDAEFQKKAVGKMQEVSQKDGRTVLFVSHQLDMIKSITNKSMLLDKGELLLFDDTHSVIDKYKNISQTGSSENLKTVFITEYEKDAPMGITLAKISDTTGKENSSFDVFDDIIIDLEYFVNKDPLGTVICIELLKEGSTFFLSFDTDMNQDLMHGRAQGQHKYQIRLPGGVLKPGYYTISLNIGIANVTRLVDLPEILTFEVVLDSVPSSLASFAPKRPGVMVSPLVWKHIK